jgi:hypothetical protein
VSVLSLPATSGPVSLQLGDVDGNGVVDAVVAASSAVLPRLMWLESPDRAAPTVAGVVCVCCACTVACGVGGGVGGPLTSLPPLFLVRFV